MERETYDVAVVGLGPVGATAANLLGRLGIRTFACDRGTEVYGQPRALGFDHEAMRIMQDCGLADEVERFVRVYPPTEYRGVDGRLISRFESVPEPFPLGWAPNYTFNQPEFERVLRAGLDRYRCVDVTLGAEVSHLEQSDGGVMLRVDDVASGRTREVDAQYVIAADGGTSGLRRQLGIEMESLDFDEPWIVIDVLCDDDAAAFLPDRVIQYCEPERPTTYVLGPGNHRRWEMMLLPGEDAATVATEARIWELLERWITPEHASLWRFATYRFHALIARSWRSGRVFLAGDAAHMTPPFLAQGMVQGLRDVHNLAWKLDLALRGAAPHMLDSYELERAPHVRATVATAKGLGQVICELDPEKARARDMRMLSELGDPPQVRLRQNLIPGLTDGLLSVGDAAAGAILPQPLVETTSGRQRLDDVTATGFRLVAHEQLALVLVECPGVMAALAQLKASVIAVTATPGLDVAERFDNDRVTTVVDVSGLLAKWFETHGCSAALVRPDHYVYGTGDDVATVEQLCARAIDHVGLAGA